MKRIRLRIVLFCAYTDESNPLSIFGRWDLGYGETEYPKQIPDGAIDAKMGSTGMVRSFMGLSGALDILLRVLVSGCCMALPT